MSTATFSIRALSPKWKAIAPLFTIETERDYDLAVRRLDELLDVVGDNERHPLYGMLHTLGTIIEAWESEHVPEPEATGIDALRFLMEQHGLGQGDLPEIGSQGVVSEILRGKRELNVRQIKALAKRFKTTSSTFID